jgi:hypothetical protein
MYMSPSQLFMDFIYFFDLENSQWNIIHKTLRIWMSMMKWKELAEEKKKHLWSLANFEAATV